MNLLPLAVWYSALLSCAVSLPRRRQIKYPVTKVQNSYCERSHPTALEVLERTLLHPSDGSRGRERSHRHSGRKRTGHRYPDIREDSTSPLYPELLEYNPDNKGDSKVNSCVASFGNESPLCKPKKRQKKSFFGIPEIHKRPFRSGTEAKKDKAITTTSDDFFGLFKSPTNELQTNTQEPNIETNIERTKTVDSKFYSNTGTFIVTSYSTPSKTELESTLQSSTSEAKPTMQIETSPRPVDKSSTNGEYVRAAPVDTIDPGEANKIIPPGSVQKIETEPQSLYLDQLNDPKNELNAQQLVESEGDATAIVEHVTPTELPEHTTQLTIPPLKSSFLTGKSYTKIECESQSSKSCICTLSSVDTDFREIFTKAKTGEEIMEEVANMKCRHYGIVASKFDLNTNSKPRVLKGKHKPFAVDNRYGAKEVTEKSLDDFIAFSALDDGITRVFVSADVKLPCFPKPDIHLSATEADHVKYTWSYGNRKQSITQGRISEDDGDGTLTIQDIELTDSKNYTCEIDYIHPDTGERTTDSFVHSLSVVTLPTVSVRTMIHYKSTAACDESLLEMFEMYLPQQLEKTICSPENDRPQLCSVVIHSPVCHDEGQQTQETPQENENTNSEVEDAPSEWYREKREDSMEMSLNYDVFIHRTAAKELPGTKAKLCDPDCHLIINFKLLQIFKETMQEVARIPIISNVQGGGTFTPVSSSVKVKYIFGCIGGYYLDNGFCLACPKGTYSDDGATECQKCPIHTYSGFVGTRKCTQCRHMWMPICNETFESINVVMIAFVINGVVVLLLCFLLYYIFWYKGLKWGEFWKKAPEEKIAKSERVRKRKEAKRLREEEEKEAKRKAKFKEKEMQRLLETSGESEAESEPELKTKKDPPTKTVPYGTSISLKKK